MKTILLVPKLIIAIGLFFVCYNANSQTTTIVESDKTVDTLNIKEPSRLKFGCGFGLNFLGGTNISLSPNLTYKVSDKIAFGFGIQGSYAAIKNLQSTTTYGANVLALYTPIQKITMSLEFAQLRVSTKNDIVDSTNNYWDSALFVGAGFNITKKISLGAKYNLLYKENESVYTSPIIPFVNITF
jgi:hypothetical protein